ncbi:MAG: L-lactate dehydrogenase, partial [Clostridia bacterium]|nr:L-lactate dehydrogenase [Clostridia bacterium]
IKSMGIPANQIIGTGTLLDSNRLAQAISDYCKVDVSNVNAYVFGEHGESCMVPWSLCTVCGMPIKEYCKKIMGVSEEVLNTELENIYTGMVKSGAKVIKAKGATFYAIAASTVKLIKAIFADNDTLLTLSTNPHGAYGADDMCLGVPCVVNGSGLKKVVELEITEDEKKLFSEKIASLDATYNALEIR